MKAANAALAAVAALTREHGRVMLFQSLPGPGGTHVVTRTDA